MGTRRLAWAATLLACAAPLNAAEPPTVVLPAVLPGSLAAPAEAPLKDLTPPGFADLIPPERHHDSHTPGHLTPAAPAEGGLFAGVEYLLQRPRADGLDYAITNRTTGLATEGPIAAMRYDLGSGLRVEAGYRFEESRLEASFVYTRLKASGGESVAAGPGQLVLPTLTRPGLTDSALSATAGAKLDYNLYDIVVGRRYALDEHVAVRGFGGVRLADIGQEFGATYDGLDARQAVVATATRFRGVGPVVGAEGVFAARHGFHVYGRATGALLSGPADNFYRDANDGGRTVSADLTQTLRKVVPTAGLAIGAGWQYRTVTLRAGYEVTHWFGLTDRVRLASDVAQGAFTAPSGNLSVEGLFIQFSLAY